MHINNHTHACAQNSNCQTAPNALVRHPTAVNMGSMPTPAPPMMPVMASWPNAKWMPNSMYHTLHTDLIAQGCPMHVMDLDYMCTAVCRLLVQNSSTYLIDD